MESNNEAIIERIRKLMKYAADGSASEGEVENALDHARKLMDKYNIDEGSVLVDDESARKTAYESVQTAEVDSRVGNVPPWFKTMARTVCNICDVKWYGNPEVYKENGRKGGMEGKWRKHRTLNFYGLPRDVAVAKELYAELRSTIHAMAWFRCGKDGWKPAHHGYASGFADRLYSRSVEMKAAGQQVSNTTAIVLAKDVILNQFGKEKLGLVVSRRSVSKISDSGAYADGYRDGANASLGTSGIRGREQGRLT